MKTLQIIDLCRYGKRNIMLYEYLRQDAKKINKDLFVTAHEQKQMPFELIPEKENERILEKLKQYSKEFFGI